MELHQLRCVRAVVRSGSVTAAATLLHIAQPAVSKQIRLVEQELGTPLFHRVGRRVVPTEAGLEVAACASRVLDEIDASAAAVRGEGGRRSLSLCATETVTEHLLPPVLTGLLAAHPSLSLSIETVGTDDAVRRLLDDSTDLAIVVLPLADSRLQVAQLFTEQVLLAVPRGHQWDGAVVGLVEALSHPDLLLSMRGLGLRAQVEAEAASRGIVPAARLELRSQQALLAMVGAGAGVAFAPRISVAGRRDVGAARLDPPLYRQVGWAYRRGRFLPPLATELVQGVAAQASLRTA